ncbi:MAG: B12-binding domain-containing radical SAM protein [Candidatus Heimdallarchaeota archaeon]
MTEDSRIAVIDATAAGKGKRTFTREAIGAGTRSICGVLEKHHVPAKIFLVEEILAKGFPEEFTTLFLSGMSMDKTAIRKAIALWRKDHFGKVVVGGPITSELLSALTTTMADIIVIGEGELTLEELLTKGCLNGRNDNSFAGLLEQINGIGFFSTDGKPKLTQFRRYSTREEFRAFQASTARITDYPNYFSAKVYVEVVRGCSNFGGTRLRLPDGRQCIECGACDGGSLERRAQCPSKIPPGCGFCSVPSLFGPARSRTINSITHEIAELLDLGVKRIVLSAPGFLDFGREELVHPKPLINPSKPPANLQKIEELLSAVTAIKKVAQQKVWVEIENVKAALFTEAVARIIAKYLPHSPLSIGCETGSSEHARLLGRSSDPQEALRAVKIAHKHGLRPHVYFIHSLPGQNKKTATETAQLMKKMVPYIEKVTIYRFRPLPLSAFSEFPLPPAAMKDPASKIIAETANSVNFQKKRNYLGTIVRVIISEPSFKDKTGAMASILSGGPMVAIKNANERIGEIVDVRIRKVLSDKLLYGEILGEKDD